MSKPAQFLDAGNLRIQFKWHHDRWAHSIGFIEDAHFRSVLESIEGAAEDEWPCSPPFQELQIESRGSQNVALLVGQTPKRHWSLSIEADSNSSILRFDVACRVPAQEALGTLSSTYQSVAGKPAIHGDEESHAASSASRAIWTWSDRLTMQAESGSSLWPASGGVVVEADPEEFVFPATFRWQYKVCCK
jgi:hypothetical protein